MTILESMTTRTAIISLRSDGLLHFSYLPNVQETLEDARENVATGLRLSSGKRLPLLVDIRAMQGVAREVRAYYSSAQSISARALLVESPVSRLIANFVINLNKPVVPTRLFTSEEAAVAWLESFLQ